MAGRRRLCRLPPLAAATGCGRWTSTWMTCCAARAAVGRRRWTGKISKVSVGLTPAVAAAEPSGVPAAMANPLAGASGSGNGNGNGSGSGAAPPSDDAQHATQQELQDMVRELREPLRAPLYCQNDDVQFM